MYLVINIDRILPQYAMLCGHAPFYGQSASTEEIMQRIRIGQFSFEGSEWSSVSQAAKSIIEGRLPPTVIFLGNENLDW